VGTVGQLEDHHEIEALVYAYAQAVDDRDGEALAALFSSGGRIRVFSMGKPDPVVEFGEPERLAGMVEVIARTYTETVHLVANHRITLDGDRATGAADCIAHHYIESEDRIEDEALTLRYRDSYLREPGGWRFEVRDIHRLWTEFRPAGRRPLTVDLVAAGRITLPER
jgi:hypothetical protein